MKKAVIQKKPTLKEKRLTSSLLLRPGKMGTRIDEARHLRWD